MQFTNSNSFYLPAICSSKCLENSWNDLIKKTNTKTEIQIKYCTYNRAPNILLDPDKVVCIFSVLLNKCNILSCEVPLDVWYADPTHVPQESSSWKLNIHEEGRQAPKKWE